MMTSKQWEVISSELKVPCLLADLETDTVEFVNDEMRKLFPRRKHIIGEAFYNLIQNDSMITTLDFLDTWKQGDIFIHKIFDLTLGRGFITTHLNIEINGYPYHFCKYEPTENLDFNFEDTISQCISIIQGDESKKIPTLLKTLGEFYVSKKAFMYQVDYNTMTIPCSFFWKKYDDMSIFSDLSEQIPVDELLSWCSSCNEVGIIEASTSHAPFAVHPTEEKILSALNLQNIVLSVLKNEDGDPLAIVGISDRENTMADYRLLQAISGFLEKDVTEANLTMTQMNAIDILTGFYSRNTYNKKLDRLRYKPPQTLGVVFANINGLRRINSEFGLARGDSLIKKIAESLHTHFHVDFYRIAGDEFVAFFPDVTEDYFYELAHSYLEICHAQDDNSLALGHAWGQDKVNPINLITEADRAMYINKQDFYHATVEDFSDIVDSTLHDLLHALAKDEFIVYLQPKIRLSDKSLYGAEALVRRLNKEENVLLMPEQFISKYEHKSVIRHIDVFVIDQVCQILADWYHQGLEYPISVNLSRVTLLEYGIVETIAELCDKYKVPHHLLVIEVSEGVNVQEYGVPSATIVQGFRDNGFVVALDDFGSAHSNIVTLSQIDIDEVKIDRSLISFLHSNQKSRILVKNVLSMCQDLENTVALAEGIESEDQITFLKEHGCQLGQGYYFSPPLSVSQFQVKYLP